MNKINKMLGAKLITQEGVEYEVRFPKSDNSFRFFPALSKIIGTTTKGIINLTVDNIVLPKELLRQEIMNKVFTLRATVFVGEQIVCAYDLETKIKISNNAYTTQNIKAVDDINSAIAPMQIEIPAYKTISLKERI